MPINIDEVRAFERYSQYRRKVDHVRGLLMQFRREYPFVSHPESIDNLDCDDIYDIERNRFGNFSHWIVFHLKDLGFLSRNVVFPTVFKNICKQLNRFKELLMIVVDEQTSLADKVDAPWKTIKRMGGDQHLAKKIICCHHFLASGSAINASNATEFFTDSSL